MHTFWRKHRHTSLTQKAKSAFEDFRKKKIDDIAQGDSAHSKLQNMYMYIQQHDATRTTVVEDDRPNSVLNVPRSVLFVPCINERALNKIPTLNADVFILDLEDSVAPTFKQRARENLIEFLDAYEGDQRFVIRTNSARVHPDWGRADLEAIAGLFTKYEAIAVPKVQSSMDAFVVREETHPDTKLWAFFETPRGVVHAAEILQDGDYQLAVVGTNDLASDMMLPQPLPASREPLLHAISQVVLAARASGLPVIDGVFNDIVDIAGLKAECEQGKMLGFDGKSCIHPKQAMVINSLFSPTEAEVERAKRVIKVSEEKGGGIAMLDNAIIEELHARHAKRVLYRDECAQRDKEETKRPKPSRHIRATKPPKGTLAEGNERLQKVYEKEKADARNGL